MQAAAHLNFQLEQVRSEPMPQEAAQGLLQAMPEEELLAEVYRIRVLTLVPLTDKGSLVPEAEAALEVKYLQWCQPRGGGDCLGLFTDGPYLRTDDRRTLALAASALTTAGALAMRFAVFQAGKAGAREPRATFRSQRHGLGAAEVGSASQVLRSAQPEGFALPVPR